MTQGFGLLELLAIGSSAVFAAALAWVVVRPHRNLAGRLRPYLASTRTRLGRSADVLGQAVDGPAFGHGTFKRLFGPIVEAGLARFSRLVSAGTEEQLAVKLRQADLYPRVSDAQKVREYRVRSFSSSFAYAGGVGLLGLLLAGPAGMLLLGVSGFVMGVLLARSRLEKAVAKRRDRIRGELYTVNQLIAMRTRVGGGVVDALRHTVARGNGAFVDDLAEVLRLHETGVSIGVALQRASDLTPEPQAARTYRVLATAQEHGADLGEALLALSKDLRQERREGLQREAAQRRLAMVLPMIVILGPIVLLFLAAPIPSLIFGNG